MRRNSRHERTSQKRQGSTIRRGCVAAVLGAAIQTASVSIATQAADLSVPPNLAPVPQAPKIEPVAREPILKVPPAGHVATPAVKQGSSAQPSEAPKASAAAELPSVGALERPQVDPGQGEAALWFALLMLVLLGWIIRRLVEAAFARRPVPLETLTHRSIAEGHRPTEDELLGALFDTLNGRSGRDLELARQRVRELAHEISTLNRSSNRS